MATSRNHGSLTEDTLERISQHQDSGALGQNGVRSFAGLPAEGWHRVSSPRARSVTTSSYRTSSPSEKIRKDSRVCVCVCVCVRVCVCGRGGEGGAQEETEKGREIKEPRKESSQERKRNLDGTVENLPLHFSASSPGLGFTSSGAPDLAVFQLSARPLPAAPSPGLRPPLCLPVTSREPGAADSGGAQSQDGDVRPDSPTPAPRAAGLGRRALRYLEKWVLLWSGGPEKLFFALPLGATRRTRGLRQETTPSVHSSFRARDIRPHAPRKEDSGVREANANPDPGRQRMKGSRAPRAFSPGWARADPRRARLTRRKGGGSARGDCRDPQT
nr:uncharacterized protein LOC123478117 [Desmodus rotundus]